MAADRRSRPGRPAARQGVVLLAVLWALLIAGLLLAGFERRATVRATAARAAERQLRARWLARAALAQARAALASDTLAFTALHGPWFDDPARFTARRLAGGSFTIRTARDPENPDAGWRAGMIDHSARVNLNLADVHQLRLLPGLASSARAILDWRDRDDQPRAGGAEDAYYLKLPRSYRAAGGPLLDLEDLMRIRGLDRRSLAGRGTIPVELDDDELDDSSLDGDRNAGDYPAGTLRNMATAWSWELNLDRDGLEPLNVNHAPASEIVRRLGLDDNLADAIEKAVRLRPLTRLAALTRIRAPEPADPRPLPRGDRFGGDQRRRMPATLDPQWLAANLDRVTLWQGAHRPGRINVNTASRDVLLTLPGMDAKTIDGLIRLRESAEGPFQTVGALVERGAMPMDRWAAMVDLITVRSTTFEVEIDARTDEGPACRVNAVLCRAGGQPVVIYWREL